MSWTRCVIDASMGVALGNSRAFCFCPLGDDGRIVTGMNYVSETPPAGMQLVGVVHEDGQEACEWFCKLHKQELDDLYKRLPPADPGITVPVVGQADDLDF